MVDYAKAIQTALYCKEIYRSFPSVMFQDITDEPILISERAEEMSIDTQCAILLNGTAVTIVFRGSDSDYDWETNFDTAQERAEFDRKIIKDVIVEEESREQDYPYDGKNSSESLIHRGFTAAYFAVRDQLHAYIDRHDVTSLTVTGHSLGGALATLCAVDMQYNFADRLDSIEAYTYGSPKVGNRGFSASYNQRVPDSYRIVNGVDIVPALPRWWQGKYVHVAQEIHIGSRFTFNFVRARIKDHGIANYITALKAIVSSE